MTDFVGGLIIGGLIIIFIFFLFRDIFMRHLLTSAVPVIENTETGELISFDEFKENALNHIVKDLVYSYKILLLLKTTINIILVVNDLDDGLRKSLHNKLEEITSILVDYERMLKNRGVDIERIKKEEEKFDIF